MRFAFIKASGRKIVLLAILLVSFHSHAQSTVNVRIMAANLNGNTQSYQPFAIRILQGLKPDVVAIQEFNYASTNGTDVNNAFAMREMVDTAFGTNFYYYREPFSGGSGIPNGIVSRYPIIASGSWNDTVQSQPNRGFAWSQIELPGTNDLYVVSVHMLTSSAANRAAESGNLLSLMQANFPSNAWIVVAGDFNADPRTETCITTFNGYLTDNPIPVDNNGNANTSSGRNHPHDYVLPSLTLTNFETATVLPSHSFPGGLVFDSSVYTPLSDVVPVLSADSGQAQHMAVMKDFLIPVTDSGITNPPAITAQPQSQTTSPGSNATFTVTANGTAPLSFQWLFNDTNIVGATANPFTIANVQFTNAGNYSVIVTNLVGSVTSSVALLIVSNFPPAITTQPQSQTVTIGSSPTFNVIATGTAPLSYQWFFSGTNIPGGNTNAYTRSNVQTNDAGNYFVIVTNIAGSVTSSVAALSVFTTQAVVIAQWNFNSAAPDANVATGTTTPSIGSGAASLVGGTSGTFATGDTNLDTAGSTDNSGWNTATYPAATANNKSAGVQFSVNTAGKQNIVIVWSQRASNTGSKYARLRYSSDGTNFADYPAAVFVSAGAVFEAKTNSLSGIAGVDDNPNFAFQIVTEFQSTATGSGSAAYVAANTGSTYAGGASGGTLRFDMVTVSGTAILTNSTPSAPPALGGFIFPAGGGFQFNLTGTTGATYIVQLSTNLASGNWLPLFTNTAPFSFTDLNCTLPHQFYRAVSSP